MIGSRLGLTPDDLETLALALCATRGEHPEGMQYGGLWRPEGVTFLEIARRDVGGVLQALASLPAWQPQ